MPKKELFLEKPLMNAAGTLGFYPDMRGPLDLSACGAFVTNPISKLPRTPANGERYVPYPGGFLLHTGLPNPGLSQVLRQYRNRWERSPMPLIVHLLAERAASLASMIARLETMESVLGVEIGLPPEIDPESAYAFVEAAVGELPVIVRLPLEQCQELALEVIEAGASAVSLGAPRGVTSAAGRRVSGRLYGPSIFPLALRAVEKLTQMAIPVIGAGGVYSQAHVEAMLAAGALAVQLDAVLWRGGIANQL